jgi:hypothetical protein
MSCFLKGRHLVVARAAVPAVAKVGRAVQAKVVAVGRDKVPPTEPRAAARVRLARRAFTHRIAAGLSETSGFRFLTMQKHSSGENPHPQPLSRSERGAMQSETS